MDNRGSIDIDAIEHFDLIGETSVYGGSNKQRVVGRAGIA